MQSLAPNKPNERARQPLAQAKVDESSKRADKRASAQEENRVSGEPTDDEPVVGLYATKRIIRGQPEEEHRQSPSDTVDQESRYEAGQMPRGRYWAALT